MNKYMGTPAPRGWSVTFGIQSVSDLSMADCHKRGTYAKKLSFISNPKLTEHLTFYLVTPVGL